MPADLPPCCPYCEYEVGSDSITLCPECGHPLPADPRLRVSGGWRTPWSKVRPLALWRGLPAVLLRPRRALDAAREPVRVAWSRSILFAAICSAIPICCWTLFRTAADRLALVFELGFAPWWKYTTSPGAWSHLAFWPHWVRLAKWELIAQARWWVFFAAIAAADRAVAAMRPAAPPREPASTTAKRFLLFSPWFVALELAFLIGVHFHTINVITEPSTVFVTTDHWYLAWMRPVWLVRGAVPSALALFLFFRVVLLRGRTTSIIAAILLVPAALWISVACGVVYLELLTADIL